MALNHPFATKCAMILILHIIFHAKLKAIVHVASDKQMSIVIGIILKQMCKTVSIPGPRLIKIIIQSLPNTLNFTYLLSPHQTSFSDVFVLGHNQTAIFKRISVTWKFWKWSI